MIGVLQNSWLFVIGVGNLVLFMFSLFFFLNKKNLKDIGDFKRFRFYLLLLLLVVVVHLVEVNFIDPVITGFMGNDFTSYVASFETGLALFIHNLWFTPLLCFFVIIYIIVYPFTLWFSPFLFILSNDEKAMKWFSYGFVMVYILALPFYLLMPTTNVYTYFGFSSALESFIPGVEQFFYSTTTHNNCFPSLHVAAALLIAIAAWKSGNKKYKYFTTIDCVLVIISVAYLSIHWFMDIIGGVGVVLVTAILLGRKIDDIEKKVLEKIIPSEDEKEEIDRLSKKILNDVKDEIRKLGVSAKPLIVGSVAKDTFLKDKVDIDVFVQFPKETSRERLEKYGLEIGRKILREREERYAEHPYVRGKYNGFTVEIVPCYEIKDPSQRISAVDRTPFHTQYVKENLPEKLKKDVRLLKQFLRGIGAYGAEAEIEGFSGYLCELLILKYKGFRNLLRASQKWKKYETIIKIDDRQEIDEDLFGEEPLIVVDPVDPRRNVASALSEEKLDLFIRAAKEYLRKPSIKFFFPREEKPWGLEKIRKELAKLDLEFVGVKIVKPDIISDNLYPQIRKSLKSIVSICQEYDFDVKKYFFYVSDNNVYFIIGVKKSRLPDTLVHVGPPDHEKKHVDVFIEKWSKSRRTVKGPYIKDGRWYVEIKRKYMDIKDLLRDNFKKLSLGKHVSQIVDRKGFEILDYEKLVVDDLRRFWTDVLDERMPWER